MRSLQGDQGTRISGDRTPEYQDIRKTDKKIVNLIFGCPDVYNLIT
jgi:hypothetical protein